jgi:hypothetical protein
VCFVLFVVPNNYDDDYDDSADDDKLVKNWWALINIFLRVKNNFQNELPNYYFIKYTYFNIFSNIFRHKIL